MHASRAAAGLYLRIEVLASGERVSNTWVTSPEEGDTPSKGGSIPYTLQRGNSLEKRWHSVLSPRDGLTAYQLVGEVTAHQGYDG